MWVFFVKALTAFGYNLLIALVGEAMIQWVFFKVTKWLASKTPTKIDDEFVDKLEDNYKNKTK